ncbi:hypothetical protein [Nocardioides dilutus]
MGIRHAVKNLSGPSVVAGLVLGLACAGGGAIAAGQITGAQIKDRTITHRDVASDTLKSRTVKNESLRGKDIKDGSLSNQDIDVFYAVLTDEGVVVRQSGGVTGLRLTGEGPGRYAVDFNVDVTACAYVAAVGNATFGAAEGQAGTGLLSGTVDTVRVNTTTSDGTTANKPFHLIVVC